MIAPALQSAAAVNLGGLAVDLFMVASRAGTALKALAAARSVEVFGMRNAPFINGAPAVTAQRRIGRIAVGNPRSRENGKRAGERLIRHEAYGIAVASQCNSILRLVRTDRDHGVAHHALPMWRIEREP